MSDEALSRRQRERRRHKHDILNVALRLFSSRGFHNVSMQEIAEAAEFGVGTLYTFFDGKEALFEELIDSTGQLVLEELSEILDGPGSETERLAAFIRCQPTFHEKHGEVIKLFVSEVGLKGSRLAKIKHGDKVHKMLDTKIAEIIDQGIRKGQFRAVDPVIAAKTLGAITETLVFEMTGQADRQVKIEMFQKVEQLFLGGLLCADEPKAKS